MPRSHDGKAFAGKAGYVVACTLSAVVLMVSGFAYYVKDQVAFIGGSDVISGGPETGAMNILLMGLESRTDYDGNILPANLLKALHAGSVQGVENGVGGQDTNTLILIHIFAGGQKAVGFSIPRDDWVTFPKTYDGQSQGKIDQAYGLAWAQSLSQTANSGMSHNQRYLVANEAGQAATIATIEQLTGVHVDHFAEVNLAGFYQLAQTFGGIEACLVPWNGGQNLHDANSGFSQSHAGYVFLSPAQALAFVRERDNLPNGDIDRTHRQQAVIDYVVWKLEERRGVQRHRPAHGPARRGEEIRDHRLWLADPHFRQRDEKPDREEPDLPDGAGHQHRRSRGWPDRQPHRSGRDQEGRAEHLLPADVRASADGDQIDADVAAGQRDHRGRLQRRRHARAGRPAVPGADVGRLQGGQGRQHRAASRPPGCCTARERRRARRRSPGISAA